MSMLIRMYIYIYIYNILGYFEANCFKNLVSQVAADGGCERDVLHRMNEEYRAWRALKVC